MDAMPPFPSFGEKPQPATRIAWSHLAGLIVCAAAVFLFTFGVAMVGFGLGVSGGVSPFTAKDNDARLAWNTPQVEAVAEVAEAAPVARIVRPRREEPTPAPEFRIIQASADKGLTDGIDWHNGWAPDQSEHEVENVTSDGDELIAPETAFN
ncbi:MAG: hypothetical protein JNJ73_07935 [Hyphomonadaceae bacterium]|nr:hypothetical protein [Hyphomonadaceae bacterium]